MAWHVRSIFVAICCWDPRNLGLESMPEGLSEKMPEKKWQKECCGIFTMDNGYFQMVCQTSVSGRGSLEEGDLPHVLFAVRLPFFMELTSTNNNEALNRFYEPLWTTITIIIINNNNNIINNNIINNNIIIIITTPRVLFFDNTLCLALPMLLFAFEIQLVVSNLESWFHRLSSHFMDSKFLMHSCIKNWFLGSKHVGVIRHSISTLGWDGMKPPGHLHRWRCRSPFRVGVSAKSASRGIFGRGGAQGLAEVALRDARIFLAHEKTSAGRRFWVRCGVWTEN